MAPLDLLKHSSQWSNPSYNLMMHLDTMVAYIGLECTFSEQISPEQRVISSQSMRWSFWFEVLQQRRSQPWDLPLSCLDASFCRRSFRDPAKRQPPHSPLPPFSFLPPPLRQRPFLSWPRLRPFVPFCSPPPLFCLLFDSILRHSWSDWLHVGGGRIASPVIDTKDSVVVLDCMPDWHRH